MSPTPYDDLLSYPYRGITSHPPMPLADRAAQFSPFAALTGYDNVIQEAARYTDEPVELAEDEQLLLNEKLRLLAHSLSQHPVITVTFFRADEQKEGGAHSDGHRICGKSGVRYTLPDFIRWNPPFIFQPVGD